MPDISVNINSRALQERLRELSAAIAQEVLTAGLTAAGQVMEQAVLANTPVKTGLLKSHVTTEVHTSPNGTSGVVSVGFDGGQGHIARFVEYGHRIVKPGTKHLEVVTENGKVRISRDGEADGFVNPHPFMRRSLEESKDAAVEAFAEAVEQKLKGL